MFDVLVEQPPTEATAVPKDLAADIARSKSLRQDYLLNRLRRRRRAERDKDQGMSAILTTAGLRFGLQRFLEQPAGQEFNFVGAEQRFFRRPAASHADRWHPIIR